MQDITIYDFTGTGRYAIKSIIPGQEQFRRFYFLTILPHQERVTFIYPFVFKYIDDFMPDTPYKIIPKDSPEYFQILEKASELAKQRIKAYIKEIKEQVSSDKLTKVEGNSMIRRQKGFYYDLTNLEIPAQA